MLYTTGLADAKEYMCLHEFVRSSLAILLENTFTKNLAVTA